MKVQTSATPKTEVKTGYDTFKLSLFPSEILETILVFIETGQNLITKT
jgi:hypothetical protein